MVDIKVKSLTIDGRTYGTDKSGYPMSPTVFSGVDIQWGSGSCIENPEASRAQISLWVPKTHADWIPSLGDVVNIRGGAVKAGVTSDLSLFAGKVESVKMQDDHKTVPTGIPNSTGMTNLVGWLPSWSPSTTGTYTDLSSSTKITGGNTLNIPFPGALASVHNFKVGIPTATVEGGKKYTFTYTSNSTDTPDSHESIVYKFYTAAGAFTGSGSQIIYGNKTITIDVPTGVGQLALEVDATIKQGVLVGSTTYNVGSVFLTQNSDAIAGYRINIVAADALAEASRLRLADSPWPFESVTNRQDRIAKLATSKGVQFYGGLTFEQGYQEAFGAYVIPRDVDSAPALETFQRTAMAAGHTVISVGNAVTTSNKLRMPSVISASSVGASAVGSWNGTRHLSRSTLMVNGTATRTNWATNPSVGFNSTGWSLVQGAGGVATLDRYSYVGKYDPVTLMAYWTTAAPSGSSPSIDYIESTVAGVSGSKISVSFWAMLDTSQGWDRGCKFSVTLLNGATVVNTYTSPTAIMLPWNKVWKEFRVDGITASGAFDTVKVSLQPQARVSGGPMMDINSYLSVDALLIEKAATAGYYFDGEYISKDGTAVISEYDKIINVDCSAIVDSTFEIDTSRVINEITAEMKTVNVSANTLTDNDQVYSYTTGAKKTTPQTRTISSDWGIDSSNYAANMADAVVPTKASLLLAGQSTPQWRLSNSLELVLSKIPESEYFDAILSESSRFGALVKINNGPSLLPTYLRVHAGHFVFGAEPSFEFEVEPVEYSAPIPLTKYTLDGDRGAASLKLGHLKNVTSNTLRSIGAR